MTYFPSLFSPARVNFPVRVNRGAFSAAGVKQASAPKDSVHFGNVETHKFKYISGNQVEITDEQGTTAQYTLGYHHPDRDEIPEIRMRYMLFSKDGKEHVGVIFWDSGNVGWSMYRLKSDPSKTHFLSES